MEKKKTAHIISHSHWDREWYMSFEEHRYYLVKLMDALLELSKKDTQFESFHLDGQTIILEDYLEIRPEKKEELKELIKKKKLHVGPWYVLQDAFLTSGEANVRNLLYGFKDAKEYGAISKLGYFPDTFGIYGQAPQLLNQAGIETAAFGRGVKPTGFNNTVSDAQSFESPYSEMKWVSPDGSSVLGILFANWYSNGNEIPEDEATAKRFWEMKLKDAEKYASTPHLLFMNGCDHQPVQGNMARAIQTAKDQFPNIDFVHSNFDEYIDAVRKELPATLQTINGELRNQRTDGWSTLVNTASARIYLKQMNQECQTLLEKLAEPISVVSYLTGGEYPRDYLRYAWKTLMKNHPHDSICGCSVDVVHKEMVTRYEKVKQTASMIIHDKVHEMAGKINTEQDAISTSIPIIVFNTSGNERTGLVEKEIEIEKVYFSEMPFSEIPDFLKAKEITSYQLTSPKGKLLPFSIQDLGIRFGYDLPDDAFRRPYFARTVKVVFSTKQLPSLGYQTYYLSEGENVNDQSSCLINNNTTLDNNFLKVEVHSDGSYTIHQKQTGRIFANLGVYEDSGDIGNEYMFKKAANEMALTTKGLKAEVKVIENSSIRGILEIVHHWDIPEKADDRFEKEKEQLVWHKERISGRSANTVTITITTQLILEKDEKGLSVKTTIDNQAMDHRIRVLYPTNLQTDHHYADSVFEVVKRPNAPEIEWENPSFDHHQHAFVSLSDDHNGLTIANKGLNEYEILAENSTIAVTILRSVSELGDWGWFPTPEAQCIGTNTAEWMVIPHEGNVIESKAYQLAYNYQTPLIVLQSDIHKGELPKEESFLQWDGDHLAVTSVKVGEEANDIFVRWFNTSDRLTQVNAELKGVNQSYRSTILEEQNELQEGSKVVENINPYEILTIGWKGEK